MYEFDVHEFCQSRSETVEVTPGGPIATVQTEVDSYQENWLAMGEAPTGVLANYLRAFGLPPVYPTSPPPTGALGSLLYSLIGH